jgi:hypothetical protein
MTNDVYSMGFNDGYQKANDEWKEKVRMLRLRIIGQSNVREQELIINEIFDVPKKAEGGQ